MRERPSRTSPYSIDVVLVTAMGNELAILLTRGSTERERWALPWRAPQAGETLGTASVRLGEDALGEPPIWTEQIGAFGDAKRHPSEAEMSVAFVGLVPHQTASTNAGYTWFPMRDLPPLSPRQRAMVEAATRTIQGRLDQAPIAFRLLPSTFTLSELQRAFGVPFKAPGSSNPRTNGAVKGEADRPNSFGTHRRKGADLTGA